MRLHISSAKKVRRSSYNDAKSNSKKVKALAYTGLYVFK